MAFVGGGWLPGLEKVGARQEERRQCRGRRSVVVVAETHRSGRGGRRGRGRRRSFESGPNGLRDEKGGRRRPSRVSELMKRELSEIIRQTVAGAPKSAGLTGTLVSVLDVDMSPDLRNATVFVSILEADGQKGDVLRYLKNTRKTIRTILSQRMREMKSIPELRFSERDLAAGFQTLEILNKLSRERELKDKSGENVDTASPDLEDDDGETSAIFDDDEEDEDDERR